MTRIRTSIYSVSVDIIGYSCMLTNNILLLLTLQELGDKDKNEYIFCLGGIQHGGAALLSAQGTLLYEMSR